MTSGPMPSPAITASFMTDPPLPASVALTSRPMADQNVGGHRPVQPQHDRRALAFGVLAELRGEDVDARAAQQRADLAQRARLVVVVDDQVDALGAQIEVAAVDLDDLLHQLRARQRARDVDRRPVGVRPRARRPRCGGWGSPSRWRCRRLHAALGRQRRRVDEGHLILDHRREQPAQRRELEHLDVFGGQLTAHLHRQRHRQLARQHADEQAELADQVEPGRHLFADDAAADVDRVGHELPRQRELRRWPRRRCPPGPAPRRWRRPDVASPPPVAARTADCRCTARWRTRPGPRRGRVRWSMASASAASSISPPRAALTMMTPGLVLASASLPISPAVSLVLGRWTEMKSARPRSSSSVRSSMPSCAARACDTYGSYA